ncbi:MAG: IS256 family transposase [Deltaproteobacteria bacterium]|nr:IS256 family transposase [Deltaproteobacteria bacterium]
MTNEKTLLNNPAINFQELQEQIVAEIRAGKDLLGKDGLLTPLIKSALEATLEGEMEAHLEEGSHKKNRRNGKSKKTVKHSSGSFELETPRDRDSSFEPEIVKKRQTVLNHALDEKILGLFGLGMSYDDIRKHLSEMYGVDISSAKISAVTDKLIPIITQWRSRPLESIYPIIFLDAMFFKAREEGKVIQKAVYNILGINQEGRKEILGFYAAETEGANFWLGVLNDLKNRGVEDVLIACVDGLTGFPEAIQSAFPQTEVQLCVVHQIRQSIRYVASKDQKAFLKDLKTVYAADTKDLAEQNLLILDEKWGAKYPIVLKSWQTKWDYLSGYFKYTKPVRRLIYTTNPIEGFHRQVRKYTKSKGAFTSETALFKLIYSAIQQIKKKWSMPVRDWAETISQLDIYFEGRLNVGL